MAIVNRLACGEIQFHDFEDGIAFGVCRARHAPDGAAQVFVQIRACKKRGDIYNDFLRGDIEVMEVKIHAIRAATADGFACHRISRATGRSKVYVESFTRGRRCRACYATNRVDFHFCEFATRLP